MDQQQYDRVASLFKEALELPPDRREVFLRQSCSGDDDLAQRVRKMIGYVEVAGPTQGLVGGSADERLDSGANIPSSDDSAGDGLIGTTIGRFHLVSVIGEGGFGVVFRAEQEHPVRRSVAIKVLKSSYGSGQESRQVIARFEAERQALALMEHPAIARVIDAGQTNPDQGERPYFVMELVNGEPITTFCERNQLNLKARLRLFMAVCQAVQHAHLRGIIHRDLKPSNILVTDIDGTAAPKVIDFGIAKAVAAGKSLVEATASTADSENMASTSTAGSDRTATSSPLLGTPQYMSPEQANGDERAIDLRTDVYSLGVVLYELLTGTTPLNSQTLRKVPYSQMLQMIVEQRVEKPSTRLRRKRVNQGGRPTNQDTETAVSSGRNSDARHFALVPARKVRGELDWITAKAIHVDRDRRYSSATELAEDISRCLRHEPVVAGPKSTTYRVRKFVRRHRLGVAAALVTIIAIMSGAVMATVGMVTARRAAQEALQINQVMRDLLTSVDPNVRGADARVSEVLRDASAAASERFAGHPRLEAELRQLIGTVFVNLNMVPESVAELKRAHELWQAEVGPDDPRTLQSQMALVLALGNQSRHRECLQILSDLEPRIVRVLGANNQLAFEGMRLRAISQTMMGHHEIGEETLRDALLQAQSAHADDRVVLSVMDTLVQNLAYQLRMVERDQVEPIRVELETMSRELAERSDQLFGPQSLQSLRSRLNLARAIWHRGDFAAAAEICRNINATSLDRLGECHSLRTYAGGILQWAEYRLGNAPAAADLALRNIQCQRATGNSLIVLGTMYEALPFLDQGGRWAEGEAFAREASDILQNYGGGHGAMIIGSDSHIARFVSLQGRLDEAQVMFDALLTRLSKGEASDEPNLAARVHLHYAGHLIKRGSFPAAEEQLNIVTTLKGDIRRGTYDTVTDDIIVEFIALYDAWLQPERAEPYRQMRLEVLREPVSLDSISSPD